MELGHEKREGKTSTYVPATDSRLENKMLYASELDLREMNKNGVLSLDEGKNLTRKRGKY